MKSRGSKRALPPVLPATALAALLALGVGCDEAEDEKAAPGEKPPPVEARPAPEKATVTGRVEQVMAIGGETTGWRVGEAEVFAHDELREHLGKKVTVSGRWERKQYVERGAVNTLRIERIEAAP